MPPRPAGPYERRWATKAAEMEFDALDRVKAAANFWVTSIASLTGIFGIVALIKGPEDISELAGGWKFFVGLVLGIALLCAFVSIFLAALSAQGTPPESWMNGATIRADYIKATKTAIKNLFWSRVLVIPAVLCLAVAIGITWFGVRTESPTASTYVLVVKRDGTTKCGELTSDTDGNLMMKTKPGEQLPLSDVDSLSTVSDCPALTT